MRSNQLVKKAKKKGKLLDEEGDQSWRELCNQDGVWTKWIVERLETEELKEKFEDLKNRIWVKHDLKATNKEEEMLRFFLAWEYDVDLTEKKLV